MPVDKQQALKLRQENNLSLRQIAAIQGVSHQAIHKAIHSLIPSEDDITQTRKFKAHEADITAIKRAQAIELVDLDTLKRWRDKFPAAFVLWYNSTYNNERLERGQSTSIQDHRVLIADLSRVCEAVRAEVGQGGSMDVHDVPAVPVREGVEG